MATDAYKCWYLAILQLKCVFGMAGLIFCCRGLYVGVWTCILVSGLALWVSGLVFWCMDLYLWCMGLYFGCLDLYLGVWTCILDTLYLWGVCILVGCLYTCRVSLSFLSRRMWLWYARSTSRGSSAGVFFSQKSPPLDFGACISLMGFLKCVSAQPRKKIQIWSICSNDYASTSCIDILCKRPVPTPQDVFFSSWCLW